MVNNAKKIVNQKLTNPYVPVSQNTKDTINHHGSYPYYNETALSWRDRICRKRLFTRRDPLLDYFSPLLLSCSFFTESHFLQRQKNVTCKGRNRDDITRRRNLLSLLSEVFFLSKKKRRANESGIFKPGHCYDTLCYRLEHYRTNIKQQVCQIHTTQPNSLHTSLSYNAQKRHQLEEEFLESLPNGTGINFFDEVLFSSPPNVDPSSFRIVMEIIVSEPSLSTLILTKFVANYISCTSLSFLPDGNDQLHDEINIQRSKHRVGVEDRYESKCRINPVYQYCASPTYEPPSVIIIDPGYNIYEERLVYELREAVLSRHNTLRRLIKYFHSQSSGNTDGIDFFKNLMYPSTECKTVEMNIMRGLGRVNIIRPRDLGDGCVAILESLRQSLDVREEVEKQQHIEEQRLHQRNGNKVKSNYEQGSVNVQALGRTGAPTILLLDSIWSVFSPSNKMYESLPSTKCHQGEILPRVGNKSGLSGQNEFVRQLSRLISRHNVFVIVTKISKDYHTKNGVKGPHPSIEGWDKILTHQVFYDKQQSPYIM